ncbi:MAG: hypothetical protein OHK0021_08640 [Bryobacter sp.]
MDELDLLLRDMANEAPPAESLAKVGPRVRGTLRRRAVTRYCLAAAAMLATVLLAWPSAEPVPLPKVPDFSIPAPDFALSPRIFPSPSQSRMRPSRPRRMPRLVDGDKLELASTDPNVVIYWSL